MCNHKGKTFTFHVQWRDNIIIHLIIMMMLIFTHHRATFSNLSRSGARKQRRIFLWDFWLYSNCAAVNFQLAVWLLNVRQIGERKFVQFCSSKDCQQWHANGWEHKHTAHSGDPRGCHSLTSKRRTMESKNLWEQSECYSLHVEKVRVYCHSR